MALNKYIHSKEFEEGLDNGHFSFKVNSKEIAFANNFNDLLSNYIHEGQVLIVKYLSNNHIKNEDFNFADLTKHGPEKRGFLDSALNWRIVDRGLNAYDKCTNFKCKANNQTVIVPRGQCSFDLTEKHFDFNFPECGSTIKQVTMGFYLCKYQISGIKIDANQIIIFGPFEGNADDVDSSEYYASDVNGNAIFVSIKINIKKLFDYN